MKQYKLLSSVKCTLWGNVPAHCLPLSWYLQSQCPVQLLQSSSSLSQALPSGTLVHKDAALHGWVARINLHIIIRMKGPQCSLSAQAEQIDSA